MHSKHTRKHFLNSADRRIYPKPELDGSFLTYFCIAAFGVLLMALALVHAQPVHLVGRFVSIQAASSSSSNSMQVDFSQEPIRVPWRSLLSGLGMACLTVTTFEVFKFLGKGVLWKRRGKAFDQFFGEGAAKNPDSGRILLQSDNVDELARQATAQAHQSTEGSNVTHEMRSFKARTWINRYDTEGAKEIRDAFRQSGLHAPLMHFADHSEEMRDLQKIMPESAPFVIAMGLGHTDSTSVFVRDLSWMEIEKRSLCGDCLQLKSEYLRHDMQHLQPANKDQPDPIQIHLWDGSTTSFVFTAGHGFLRILPAKWDILQWLEKSTTYESNDYAIILRRTHFSESRNRRQIAFVVAGFTERSTAIAAKYLATRWEELWEAHTKDKYDKKESGFGDFMAIIHGKSNLNAEWEEAIEAITPSRAEQNHHTWPPL